jgi:hypothetical protein
MHQPTLLRNRLVTSLRQVWPLSPAPSSALVALSFAFLAASCNHNEVVDYQPLEANMGPAPVSKSGTPSPAVVSGPGVVIDDPSKYSQVLVVSDVHGMYEHVVKVLQAGHVIDKQSHWSAGSSLLVVTGDSIDKGPQSIEVLKLWVALSAEAQAAGGRLVHVLGNHEAEFLDDPGGGSKQSELLLDLKKDGLSLSDLTSDSRPLGHFLMSEPVAARFGAWIFSHSGYFPKMTWDEFVNKSNQAILSHDYGGAFLADSSSILEAKKWELDPQVLSDEQNRLAGNGIFGAVFGHQPKAFGIADRSAAKDGGHFIKIDNGMAPSAGGHAGSLLRFSHPSEMNNADRFPAVEVISANGTVKSLSPE